MAKTIYIRKKTWNLALPVVYFDHIFNEFGSLIKQ